MSDLPETTVVLPIENDPRLKWMQDDPCLLAPSSCQLFMFSSFPKEPEKSTTWTLRPPPDK